MNRHLTNYILFALTILWGIAEPVTVSGQKFSLHHWQKGKAELPGIIYSIATDSAGFLWVGSEKGAGRYDGTRYLPLPSLDTTEQSFVTHCYTDRHNNVWLGYFNGNVTMYRNARPDKPVRFTESSIAIAGFAELDEVVYVVSQTQGIWRYSNEEFTKAEGIPGGMSINTVANGPDNAFLIGTEAGLYRLRPVGGTVIDMEQISAEPVKAVCRLGNSDHVIYGSGDQLYELTDANSTSSIPFPGSDYVIQGNVTTLYYSDKNELLCGTRQGLYRFEYEPGNPIDDITYLREENGLPNPIVSAVTTGIEGNTWIGTFGDGMFQFPKHLFRYWDKNANLANQNALTLEVGGPHEYWFGTESGISILSQKFQKLERGRYSYWMVENINLKAEVNTLHFDRSGNLWAGLTDGGVVLFDTASGNQLPLPPALSEIPKNAHVTHISSDEEDQIWISSIRNGVYKWTPNKRELHHYSTSNGLLHNDIFRVFHDKHGTHWFVTRGTALAKIENDVFEYISTNDGLTSLDFNYLAESHDNSLWIGTHGSGVLRIQKGELVNIGLSDGLPSEYIYAMAELREQLFVATYQGLSVLDPKTNSARQILNFEHIPDFGFDKSNAFLVSDHFVLMGHHGGISMFSGDKIETPEPPVAYLRKFVVSGKEYTPESNLLLNYDNYRMQFDFGAIMMDQNASCSFVYRLIGYDDEWISANADGQGSFSGLENGSYTLEVKCRLADNLPYGPVWNYSFEVETPFWKTNTFHASWMLAIIIGTFWFNRYRTLRLKRENQKLEETVSKRTEKIRKQNEEIEQFTYAISHDLKTPVFNIGGLVRMLESTDEDDKEHRAEIFEMLTETSSHLNRTLEQLMQVIKTRESYTDEKEEIVFAELLDEVRKSIHTLILDSGAEIIADLKLPLVYSNREMVYSVLYNFLTNAIKYRSPDRPLIIRISSRRKKEEVHFSVSDNGLGMDMNKDGKKVFAMFQRLHDHVEGSGVGLHLVNKIVTNSGGRIEVDSTLNEGSTFTAILPVQ